MQNYLNSEDMDVELREKFKSQGIELLPFRIPKSGNAESIFSHLKTSRGIVKDYRAYALLDDEYKDMVKEEPASVYNPTALMESTLKYFSGNQECVGAKIDEKIGRKALNLTFKAFRPREPLEVVPENYNSVIKVLHSETNSGFPLFGRKSDALDYGYNRMLEVRNKQKVPSPCTSFYRTQRSGDAESSKVRLVWAYPIEMTMMEGRFARPLIDYYLKNQNHPVALGMTKLQLADKLTGIQNRNFRYSLDYSQFDSRVAPWIIKSIFRFIKGLFGSNLSEDDSKAFKVISDYFLNTPLLTPYGLIKSKHGGIPSGSYFTQIIGSMVNYFLISCVFLLNGLIPFKELIYVLGDDCIVGTNYKLKHFDRISNDLKVKINEPKSELTEFGERVHFLGRYYQSGLPHGDISESVTKFVYPEKPRRLDDKTDIRMVAASYLLEHVENSQWIYKSLLKSSSRHGPMTFSDLRRRYEETMDKDTLSLLQGGSRQYLLMNMDGREFPLFLTSSVLA